MSAEALQFNDMGSSIKTENPILQRLLELLPVFQNEYANRLNEAVASNSQQKIGNCYPWHTKIAMSVLLKVASEKRHDVKIVSGGFGEFYDDAFAEKLQAVLDAGNDVSIIVWHDDPSVIEEPIKSFLSKAQKDSAGAKRGKLKLKIAGKLASPSTKPIMHFCLVGDFAYRREMPHGDFKGQKFDDFSPKVAATICFNDSAGGKQLCNLFDLAWEALPSVA